MSGVKVERVEIVSTYLDVDGQVSGARSEAVVDRAGALGLTCRRLVIQPLLAGWDVEPADSFKSGAAPVFAVEEAVRLLETGTDLVVVSGKDFLRTEYSSAERARLMAVFGDTSVAELYTELAEAFMGIHGISEDEFRELARALEVNYRKTAMRRGLKVAPVGVNDRMVTELFRLVDCANPVIDFEGEVVLARSSVAARLEMEGVEVAAVATVEVPDGPEQVGALAGYGHLREMLAEVSEQVGLDELLGGDAALELYTCFPVVPLAFMEAVGWAKTPAEMLEFLGKHAVTTTGGMNFARAPWNNPALHGLILVARAVQGGLRIGLVHGNGGLGGRQGVVVLRASGGAC